MPTRDLYRPTDARLKHGHGVWSGPFFPSSVQAKELNQYYAALRKKVDARAFEKLCKNVHGYEESVLREIMSDGYANDLALWVAIDEQRGTMGVVFPAVDEHRRVRREIAFFVRGPGQAEIDSMANTLSSMFHAQVPK